MMKPDVRQGASNKSSASWREIPSGVWALGFVSLLMDVSSEMIHALLPVYLVVVLGTTTFTVGIIEGVAEATAAILKVFSGALSDRLGKRKFLAALGYGLAAFTKPIFPLASSVGWLIAARFIDRVGKGKRGAPRDALVADISPNHIRGASFGFRQSLESAPGKERSDRWDDAAALEDAVIRGVSRFRDPGRGQGLAGVRRYLGRWDGKLAVRSGTARIAIVPNWDDDVPLAEHLPPFPGAQVQVTIPERGTPQAPQRTSSRTQR